MPKIDPTGERFFLCPKDQAAAAAAAPVAAIQVPPPANIQAPPVVTAPVFPPASTTPGTTVSVPTFTASGVVPASAVATTPDEKVSITPSRILAPVGTEVVLKASICTAEGYTLAEEKVDWMLGRNGVGEFVDVGGKGLFHPPLLSCFRAKKVDSYLAEGYTANGPLCINRGTADTSDDVNINRGDAWVSITAPNEGTSYVTAVTKGVESWNDRLSRATIYWVDVQWVFPPATVASSGRPQTLTTTLTRQTDGTPLEGYIVRYEVADGGVVSGSSGQTAELRTDANGRATVEVSPTTSGSASSQINVQVIRPASFGGGNSPRLVIANGTTQIRWTGDTQPYLPGGSSVTSEPLTPAPSLGGSATPLPTYGAGGVGQPPPSNAIPPTSTIPNIPARRPQLEIEIRGPSEAQVGSEARFEVVIRNGGDGPATAVMLNNKFQRGLSHLSDSQGFQQIEKGIGTLDANQTTIVPITFAVNAAGQLCHDVTVTCAEGVAPAIKRACITGIPAPVTKQGSMRVEKEGPVFVAVGEPALFTVTVKNTGEIPLANIELLDEYPPAFFRLRTLDQNVQITGGTIRRTIDRLDPGQSRRFDVECLATQPTGEVRTLATATANTEPPSRQISTSDEHVLEIRPARSEAGGAAPIAPAAGGGLEIRTSIFSGRTARVGTRTKFQVTIRNTGAQTDEQVAIRIQIPQQLTPDLGDVQGPSGVEVRLAQGWLEFTPVAALRSGEELTYVASLNISQAGVVELLTQAVSRNVPQGAIRRDQLEILEAN